MSLAPVLSCTTTYPAQQLIPRHTEDKNNRIKITHEKSPVIGALNYLSCNMVAMLDLALLLCSTASERAKLLSPAAIACIMLRCSVST